MVSGILTVPGANVPTCVRRLIEGGVYDPGRGRPMLERGGFCAFDPVNGQSPVVGLAVAS